MRDPVIGLPVQPRDLAGVGLQSGATTPTGGPDGAGSLTVEPWREILPVDDHERLIRQHVDALEAQDQRCHDRLAHLRDELEAMFPHGTTPEFLRSLVPSRVWRELVAGGIIRHILPIREERTVLAGAEVDPGPVPTVEPVDR